MRRRCLPSFSALVAIHCLLGECAALAADRSCSPMVIVVDAPARARWPDLPFRMHEIFDSRKDIDACASVQLRLKDAVIAVEVVLPDGRVASRSASRREDLVPVLESLLIVPQHDPAGTSEPEPAPAAPTPDRTAPTPPPSVVPDAGGSRVHERGEPGGSAPDAPGRLRAELSVEAEARTGDGQHGVGLGVLSFLEVAPWLAGFAGRVDRYEAGPSPPMIALELGVLGGRRFRFGMFALDVLAGAALAVQRSTMVTEVGPMQPPTSRTTSHAAPRALFGSWLHFSPRSTLSPFVGIDGDVGFSRAETSTDDPELPTFTVGLAVGATVGTP